MKNLPIPNNRVYKTSQWSSNIDFDKEYMYYAEMNMSILDHRITNLEHRVGSLEQSVSMLGQRIGSLEKAMERLAEAFSSFKKWVFIAVWTTFALTVGVVTLYTAWAVHDSNKNYAAVIRALDRIEEHSLQIQRLEITAQQNKSDK